MKLGRKINRSSRALQTNRSRHHIWLIATIIIVFIVWSAIAPLDEIVRGSGQVVPTMKNQIIQNLEGGIVKQIFVTEGDIVHANQTVAEMDRTRFESAYQELVDQRWSLTIKLARLQAEEQANSPFTLDPEVAKYAPEHALSERKLFEARRDELNQTTSNLSETLDLKEREVAILREMAAQEAVPRINLIRAEQELFELKSRLDATLSDFETSRAQEYSEVLVKLRQIEEQVRAREDQLIRTSVLSPINGVVNKILATTIGGVVQPGDPLAEIISLEDELRVEGRIDPRDIGFVYVGMPATVKLPAFDFSIYGTLKGHVVHVGADTILDEKEREPRPYYEVYIELTSTDMYGPAGKIDIRPGMQAQIELRSGKRTVMQYILKPLFKTTEALSER